MIWGIVRDSATFVGVGLLRFMFVSEFVSRINVYNTALLVCLCPLWRWARPIGKPQECMNPIHCESKRIYDIQPEDLVKRNTLSRTSPVEQAGIRADILSQKSPIPLIPGILKSLSYAQSKMQLPTIYPLYCFHSK